jgi:hypothetical protein
MKRLLALLFTLALSLASARSDSSADESLFAGHDPRPGLTIRLDHDRSISFVLDDKPGFLRWVIASPKSPVPDSGSVTKVSAEAGLLTEHSVYVWDPPSQTFWFGRRNMVQKETLVSKKDILTADTQGGMWSVTDMVSLERIKDAPPKFMEAMRSLVKANHP